MSQSRKTTPIMLTLRTEIYQHDELEEFFYEVEGQLVEIGGTLYLRYQEPEDKNKAATNVTIKLNPDGSVQLIRDGENRMRLRFSYQDKNDTDYLTPYGMLTISTMTHNLRVTLKDRPLSGTVAIDYDLMAGEEKLGVYHLRLKFTA
ncbi:hypothetical protein T233_00299 [Vagococcus lutrae LBD1]|uniref:DUF1934 domain-containing protein n=1 Tax=Vagococcus lutrae LBD1 TaxID=1408226 RepID=V6Q7D0_9ENTE|nr:DUF1934 domain-containing protein [Vagococcus lutrae]EST90555.1 hypothetical protein T233_00299 [Vagococcus lutrae LBD1]